MKAIIDWIEYEWTPFELQDMLRSMGNRDFFKAEKLTPVQRNFIEQYERFQKENSYHPTYRELGKYIGTSASCAHSMLKKIEEKWYKFT